ncbi:oligopeptide transport system substrate-binding protein [Nicoletella semolina]|uniref:Oligopeptide transport system substrate-binding protein n=1 Tax=Nicoletella semolina TaxID=271160 RepID=A0A4R2N6T2_9PAST|nr:ABC transporter substrate-binding protein [Nicoletella semolina]MDH2924753.1 hypothetical protein [Nicoletella semolina]TCP16623.1 oligopeptide transport system substrate-binding protein [Nicoletella semolina]
MLDKQTNKQTNKQIWIKTLIASAMVFTSSSLFAAKVPAGVQLAERQYVAIAGTEPETLDPQRMSGSPEGDIARQLFEGLFVNDPDGKVVPALAYKWEHNDDYTQWTFHIRPEAKWSNGEAVTAHDFVYAWQRLIDPKNAFKYADYLSILKLVNADEIIKGDKPVESLGIKAIDDHTLVLTLSHSIPYIPDLLTHYVLSPTPKKIIEKYGERWVSPENMVGNGAYLIDQRVVNEKITFKRNPMYWNDKETVIDKAEILMITSENAVNRYRANDLVLAGVPSVMYKKLKEEYPSHMLVNQRLTNSTLQINLQRDHFKDVRVRKALSLAVDRDILAKNVLGRGEKAAYLFTPKIINGAEKFKDPDFASWTQEERNKEAIRLLKEAGYSKQKPLEFELLYYKNESLKNIMVAVDSMWKKNLQGIVKVTLRNQEWKTYLGTRSEGKFDMVWAAWGADYNEATTYLNYFLSNSTFNDIGFKDEKYDELVKSSYKAKTDEERRNIYAQAEERLISLHPMISLYSPIGVSLKRPYLKGYEGKDPQSQFRFKDWYLEKY